MRFIILYLMLIFLMLGNVGCTKDNAVINIPNNTVTSNSIEILAEEDTLIFASSGVWKLNNGKATNVLSDVYYRRYPQVVGDELFYINAFDQDRLYKLNIADGTNGQITNERCIGFFVYQDDLYYSTFDGRVLNLSLADNSIGFQEIPTGDWFFRYLAVHQDELYGYDDKQHCICRYNAANLTWEVIGTEVYTDELIATENGIYFIHNSRMTLNRILPDINCIEDTEITARLLCSDGEKIYYCTSDNTVYSYNGINSIEHIALNCDVPRDIAVADDSIAWCCSDVESFRVYVDRLCNLPER